MEKKLKQELLKICKYYKGEDQNPYKDFGKSFWWKVEMYAVQNKDDKKLNILSTTMINYITEHHWEGDGQHDTTKEEMLKRAEELYINGIWCRDYICFKRYTFQQAVNHSKNC